MKLMLPVALAGLGALAGCVGYGGGVYGASGAYYDNPYYAGSPYYYSGAPYYGYGGSAVVIEQRYGTRYPYSTYSTRRDRDGDGVPNWRDRAPDNPRRY